MKIIQCMQDESRLVMSRAASERSREGKREGERERERDINEPRVEHWSDAR